MNYNKTVYPFQKTHKTAQYPELSGALPHPSTHVFGFMALVWISSPRRKAQSRAPIIGYPTTMYIPKHGEQLLTII